MEYISYRNRLTKDTLVEDRERMKEYRCEKDRHVIIYMLSSFLYYIH